MEDDCHPPNTEENGIVSDIDVLVHMNKFRTFIARCNEVPDEVVRKVEYVEESLIGRACCARQYKMSDFFK